MIKFTIVGLCSLALFTGCNDDGSSVSAGDQPITIENDATSQPAPELISQTDPSATLSAVADGLNPETTVISTNFFCYEKEPTSIEQPALTLVVSGSSATLFAGTDSLPATIRPGASDGSIEIVDGSQATAFDLEFNEYGQVLTPSSRDFAIEGCYQEGAAHEAALHRYLLNTPESGNFSCNVAETDDDVSLELLDNNRYRIDGQTGSYEFDSITTSDSSNVTFTSGPLQSGEAEYIEDPQTGTQSLLFTQSGFQTFPNGSAISSSSTSAVCSRQVQPDPFKLYGQASAPAVAAPQRPLSGLYFNDTSSLGAFERSDSANYVEFKPSGYLYAGLPLQGGTNCALTRPNGLPVCTQYGFDGSELSVVTPWGQSVAAPASAANNGTLQTLNGVQVELVTAVDQNSIIGTWTSQDVDTNGLAACAIGICSYSITGRTFHFRADNRFLFIFEDQSSSTRNAGILTTFSESTSNEGGTGSYRISGNRMELTVEGEQVIELPLHLTRNGRLAVGDRQFSRQ